MVFGKRHWLTLSALVTVAGCLSPPPRTFSLAAPSPQPEASASPEPLVAVTISPEERERLAKMGWPPAPPKKPAQRNDVIHLTGGDPLFGSLKSIDELVTFETKDPGKGTASPKTLRLPKEEVSLILLGGKAYPVNPRPFPLDQEAVVLDDGQLLVGTVKVSGDWVEVGSRGVSAGQVRMLNLQAPLQGRPQQKQPLEMPNDPPPNSGQGARQGPPLSPTPTVPFGQGRWVGQVSWKLRGPTSQKAGRVRTVFKEEPNPGRPGWYMSLLSVLVIGQAKFSVRDWSGSDCVPLDERWTETLTAGHLLVTVAGSELEEMMRSAPEGAFLQNLHYAKDQDRKYQFILYGGDFHDLVRHCVGGYPPKPYENRGGFLSPTIKVGFGRVNVDSVDCSPAEELLSSKTYDWIKGKADCGQGQLEWHFRRTGAPRDPEVPLGPKTPCELLRDARDDLRLAKEELPHLDRRKAELERGRVNTAKAIEELRPYFEKALLAAQAAGIADKAIGMLTGKLLRMAADAGGIAEAVSKGLTAGQELYDMAEDPSGWTWSNASPRTKALYDLVGDLAEQVPIAMGDEEAQLAYIEKMLQDQAILRFLANADYAVSKAKLFVSKSRDLPYFINNFNQYAKEVLRVNHQIARAKAIMAELEKEGVRCP